MKMMKGIGLLTCTLAFLVSLVGCGGGKSTTDTDAQKDVGVTDTEGPSDMGKDLAIDLFPKDAKIDQVSFPDAAEDVSVDQKNPDAAEDVSTTDVLDAADSADTSSGNLTVTFTKIQSPTWEVVDFQQFSAPIGTSATGYAEMISSIKKIITNHKYYTSQNLFGPDKPHSGFTTEVGEGIIDAGFTHGIEFTKSDWTKPKGIILMFTVVPTSDAPTGSSVELADGPILPNSYFPLSSDADLYKGTTLIDPEFDSQTPAVTQLGLSQNYDGYSHLHFSFAESTEFIPGDAGTYSWRVKLRDQTGAGWNLEISPLIITP